MLAKVTLFLEAPLEIICKTHKSVSLWSDGAYKESVLACAPMCVCVCVCNVIQKHLPKLYHSLSSQELTLGTLGSVQNSSPPFKVKCDTQEERAQCATCSNVVN